MKVPPLPAALPATAHPQVLLRGTAVLDRVSEVADGATRTLRINAFRINDEAAIGSFATAASRGVDTSVLFDTDSVPSSTVAGLADRGVRMLPYGTDPFKQHAKAVVADGAAAVIATDVSDSYSRQRLDAGVAFSGAPATLLDRLLSLRPGDVGKQARHAVTDAHAAGILINDPQLKADTVTRGVRAMIDGARGALAISSKDFTSTDVASRVAEAAARGVTTRVVTNETTREVERILTDGGVDLRVVAKPVALENRIALHGSIVVADDRGLVTSAFMADKALNGSRHRQSRELGVVVAGDAARQLRTIIEDAAPSETPGVVQDGWEARACIAR